MKLQYGYSIDKLNVNMKVAVIKQNNQFILPSVIISDSEEKGVILAEVMRVEDKMIKVRIGFTYYYINITHNDVVNFISI